MHRELDIPTSGSVFMLHVIRNHQEGTRLEPQGGRIHLHQGKSICIPAAKAINHNILLGRVLDDSVLKVH